MSDTTRRTREEILADWHALKNEPAGAPLDRHVELLNEAMHLDPAPRDMWCWVIGAFDGITGVIKESHR